MSGRNTGSWIVKREHPQFGASYLIGGPFDSHSIRSWWSWSANAADAYVFPTQKAAREAVKSRGGGVTIERSYGHEAHA